MKSVTVDQLKSTFEKLGLSRGDTVLAHAAIQFLGKPQGGVPIYYQAISDVLGLPGSGTLAVPAFSFGFARGRAYDPWSTPSEGMGVFSEMVRTLPEARRTPHPLQSLAVVGHHAGDLAGRDTPSAFDPGSAFERLLELDGKLLLLGATIQAASMIHYSEQRQGVPYRYWKEFRGPVNTAAGWQTRTYRMYARDLDLDARLVLAPLQEALESTGDWSSEPLNYGQVTVCPLRALVSAADRLLSADPWVFVSQVKTSTGRP